MTKLFVIKAGSYDAYDHHTYNVAVALSHEEAQAYINKINAADAEKARIALENANFYQEYIVKNPSPVDSLPSPDYSRRQTLEYKSRTPEEEQEFIALEAHIEQYEKDYEECENTWVETVWKPVYLEFIESIGRDESGREFSYYHSMGDSYSEPTGYLYIDEVLLVGEGEKINALLALLN